MPDLSFFLIALGGFVVAGVSSLVGGGLFFSVPLMQHWFPGVSLGTLVGNIKVGGFCRNLGNVLSNLKSVAFRENLALIIPLFIGTILGASIIADLDQRWLFPTLIIAVILAEGSPYLARFIPARAALLASFLVGVWTGFFGAGISVLLIFLIRLQHPQDHDIAYVKIQARFIEWLTLIVAVIAHAFHGNLLLHIYLPWAIGSLLGGLLGGYALSRMQHFSGPWQKNILRLAFGVALVIAGMKFFSG